jgi:hypothetical protein
MTKHMISSKFPYVYDKYFPWFCSSGTAYTVEKELKLSPKLSCERVLFLEKGFFIFFYSVNCITQLGAVFLYFIYS